MFTLVEAPLLWYAVLPGYLVVKGVTQTLEPVTRRDAPDASPASSAA
jgi:hypothetical protein